LTQAVLPVSDALGAEAARSAKQSVKRVAVHASQLALLAALYYLAARLGNAFRFQSSQIGVVWPASALLVAALLLTPRARWWTLLVSASLAHIAAMYPVVPVWRWEWQIVNRRRSPRRLRRCSSASPDFRFTSETDDRYSRSRPSCS
jgi:hypothetical protein